MNLRMNDSERLENPVVHHLLSQQFHCELSKGERATGWPVLVAGLLHTHTTHTHTVRHSTTASLPPSQPPPGHTASLSLHTSCRRPSSRNPWQWTAWDSGL